MSTAAQCNHDFGIGERVMWNRNVSDVGTVLDVANNGVFVIWDSGPDGWIYTPQPKLSTVIQQAETRA